MDLSRRDFLKIGSAALAGALLPSRLFSILNPSNGRSNIILISFDAMTARNMSLHGYSRETTPHLENFAGRATVYHNHSSGGNFTTPGAASMITGMFPWKHRAFNQGGMIKSSLAHFNPFSLLGSEYRRLMFSQNIWPDRLVGQSYRDVDIFLSPDAYSLRSSPLLMDKSGRDRALASIAMEEFLFSLGADTMGSSVLGYFNKQEVVSGYLAEQKKLKPDYPVGVPLNEGYLIPFLNEDVYEGVGTELSKLADGASPYFSYFHLFSPHSPYRMERKFAQLFRDHYIPAVKPFHPLIKPLADDLLLRRRTMYDMLVANVDAEFGRLARRMEAEGILNDSYVIVTSDHGEMFERGFMGHGSVLMYESNIHIPLLIHSPGQNSRQDIHTPTSNVDLLPTMLRIANREIPSELDGQVLPGFADTYNPDKPLFSMYSPENSAFAPLKKISASMRKGNHKLIATLGYSDEPIYELYDLGEDPEELKNLSKTDVTTFARLQDEFLSHLADANRPYGSS